MGTNIGVFLGFCLAQSGDPYVFGAEALPSDRSSDAAVRLGAGQPAAMQGAIP